MTTTMQDTTNVTSKHNFDNLPDWENWESVKNNPNLVSKVCREILEGIYVYRNTYDFYGLITPEMLITNPRFSDHFKIISNELKIVAATSAAPLSGNNWELIACKSAKTIFKDFAAYDMLDEYNLAYRVDESFLKWPHNMKWGVVNIVSGRELLAPTEFPPLTKEQTYIPLSNRIMIAIAKTSVACPIFDY